MTKIMIIGANGGTARILIDRLLAETDHELVLFLRHAERLAQYQSQARVTVLDGDVLDTARLAAAMAPVDLVYSNVGGVDLAAQTRSILAAMAQTKQQRLHLAPIMKCPESLVLGTNKQSLTFYLGFGPPRRYSVSQLSTIRKFDRPG